MKSGFSNRFNLFAHLAGWFLFILIPLAIAPGPGLNFLSEHPGAITNLMMRNGVWISLFYINLYIITPRILNRHPGGELLVVYILTGIILSGFISMLMDLQLVDLSTFNGGPQGRPERFEGPPNRGQPQLFRGPFFSNLLVTILILLTSSLIVIWIRWQQTEQNRRQQIIEKQAVELSMLKLQVSPHFLFNTLNNIRWLIRSGSVEAEEGIIKLSGILRYILYQTDVHLVNLSQEVQIISDFIELSRMRLSHGAAVEINLAGDFEKHLIVPLLLIPVIENFFKHGDFQPGQRNTVELTVKEGILYLSTTNGVRQRDEGATTGTIETTGSGLGLENLRRRLQLHYPGNHDLKLESTPKKFSLRLIINLNS